MFEWGRGGGCTVGGFNWAFFSSSIHPILHPTQRRATTRPTVSPSLLSGAGAGGVDISHSLKLQLPSSSSGSSGAGDGSGCGCHTLALESAAPLFAVGIACSRELVLLDAPGNVAILSRCSGCHNVGWRGWGAGARVNLRA